MKEDMKDALQHFEDELLEKEPEAEEIELPDLSDLVEEGEPQLDGPAFDDPEHIYDPEQPMVYHNYSNDYGRDLEKEAQEAKDRKTVFRLQIAACALSVGIVGVLIYCLVAFF